MTTNLINESYITVPLFSPEIETSRKFATQQLKPEHREQVFLNSLAVYAVHTYLKHGNIETDLEQSSSWHPLERALFDVSDLYIPYLNTSVECCPIKPNETRVNFTANSLDKNIMGYVAVQFLDSLDEVRLMGYLSAGKLEEDISELPLTEFGHTSNIFDDLFILDEGKIIWQEQIENIEDEKLKDFLEFLFTGENEGEITKSILSYLKVRQRQWTREEKNRALNRYKEQKDLEKMQQSEDAIERFLEEHQTNEEQAKEALRNFVEEHQESRKQVANALEKLNITLPLGERKEENSLKLNNDLSKNLEKWFELMRKAIEEILA